MTIRRSLLLASVLLAAACADAQAANFNGKFDIVQTTAATPAGTLRYYNAVNGLSIFAEPGTAADLMREALFRKTLVSIAYTPIVCPFGITGSCGTLTAITVNAGNIP
ncbi:hypothetical protein [Arenimonas oryziterrae]|uniref:Uncharacterized protein n=1 Tax=Arenimonas oryziterrae DSM 21050 = YC6267 TaxID=1121015 RepID=A0A091ATU0_9GAMM|nr:hypothetical protein [Arenimonas oryziterrae]KFN42587.1 hypothetical protein N789_13180 [Arenimonas oryziterrae DSM 21050 = YC6267]